jgi:hypothetical protein
MANAVQPVTAGDAIAITKSDTTNYDPPLAALYVGGTGDVAVKTAAGNTVVFSAVPAGFIIPIACKQVRSTSTTATLILGLTY